MTAKKKTWFYIGYFGFVKGRTTDFRDYILELERKFSSDSKALKKNYEKHITQTASDAEFENNDFYANEIYRIENVFLRIFRYSAIVTIYSLFEASKNSLCRLLKQKRHLDVRVDGSRGRGIQKGSMKSRRIAPESSYECPEIQNLKKIRDCIVHTDGDVLRFRDTKLTRELKNIVRNTSGLTLENDQYLVVEKEYLVSVITLVEDFLQELYEKSRIDEGVLRVTRADAG